MLHCQEMTAPDNVCVATHDRGSVKPECRTGLQEWEAGLSTPAIFINDSEAPRLVNLQTLSTCDRQVILSVLSAMFTLRPGQEVVNAIFRTKDNGTARLLPCHKRKSAVNS